MPTALATYWFLQFPNEILALKLIRSTRCLEKEPGPSLRLIDPNFNETCGRNVAMFVANVVRFTKPRGQSSIVFRELRDHVQGLNVLGIVIEDTLSASDLPDRSQR